MGNPYLDWALLAVILAAFCLIALCFTRLVFRLAVLAVAVAVIAGVTWLGLEGPGRPGNRAPPAMWRNPPRWRRSSCCGWRSATRTASWTGPPSGWPPTPACTGCRNSRNSPGSCAPRRSGTSMRPGVEASVSHGSRRSWGRRCTFPARPPRRRMVIVAWCLPGWCLPGWRPGRGVSMRPASGGRARRQDLGDLTGGRASSRPARSAGGEHSPTCEFMIMGLLGLEPQ